MIACKYLPDTILYHTHIDFNCWCIYLFEFYIVPVDHSLCSSASPEVNGTQSNQHASQHCGLLSQHNGSIIIEPPAGQRADYISELPVIILRI